MKQLCLIVAAYLLTCFALAADKQRDWKTGTLLKTAQAQQGSSGGPSAIAGNSNVAMTALLLQAQRSITWHGFRIQGGG
jgi:hypothetical protein